MEFRRRQFLRLAAGAAATPVVSQLAMAQSYPMRPVRDVAGVTEIEVVIDGCVPTVVGASKEQRVSVRGRPSHRFGRNAPTGTRSVLNDEWLTCCIRDRITGIAGIVGQQLVITRCSNQN